MRFGDLLPSISAVHTQDQNSDEGHEKLVRFAYVFVRQVSRRLSGM
jgi:hypothetical protein